MSQLRQLIISNLPNGFQETMSYGMLTYVVPHSIYPAGYHCNPKQALPFMSLASQKNFIAVYHMSMGQAELLNWFTTEFPKHCKSKLDMGKGCIRFKNIADIPYTLIAELAGKMTVKQWVDLYEKTMKR